MKIEVTDRLVTIYDDKNDMTAYLAMEAIAAVAVVGDKLFITLTGLPVANELHCDSVIQAKSAAADISRYL